MCTDEGLVNLFFWSGGCFELFKIVAIHSRYKSASISKGL